MNPTIADNAFDAEQARHANWKLRGPDAQPADPETRVFAHLATPPAPVFPAGFSAGVLRLHHQRTRAARRIAARLIAVAALATAACVALAWPLFSPHAAQPLLQALSESHALGALGAMVGLSLLERLLRPTRSSRRAT